MSKQFFKADSRLASFQALQIESYNEDIIETAIMTKKIKEGANVPAYVLEYLLGMYCATTDEASIEEGINTVKKILAENFVRSDEYIKKYEKLLCGGIWCILKMGYNRLDERFDDFDNLDNFDNKSKKK